MNALSLAEKIGALLAQKRATLAVAESCTGGLLASTITDIPGASRYFVCGVVAYSNESKQKLLGVSPKTIEHFGAVSGEVALEMAEGIRKTAGADYTLAVTGVAGPTGGTTDKPVGTVFIACIRPEGKKVERRCFSSGRADFKKQTVVAALQMLLGQ